MKRITTEDIEGAFQTNIISTENPLSFDVSFNRKKISPQNNIETKSVDYETNEFNYSKKQKSATNSSQKFFRRKTEDDFLKNNKDADIRKFSIFSVTKVHQNETNNKTFNDSKI